MYNPDELLHFPGPQELGSAVAYSLPPSYPISPPFTTTYNAPPPTTSQMTVPTYRAGSEVKHSEAERKLMSQVREGMQRMRKHKQEFRKRTNIKAKKDYLGFSLNPGLRFDEVHHCVWVPHQNFIPLSVDQLVNSITELLVDIERETNIEAEKSIAEQFLKVAGLYLYVLIVEYGTKTKEMHLYETVFNPALEGSVVLRKTPSEEMKVAAANKFIHTFIRTMRKANFTPMSEREIHFSDNPEQVLFGLPVKIDWGKLDSQMLTNYFRAYCKDDTPPPPPFACQCLIFWRGVGIWQRTGYFFLQKLDLLLQQGLTLLFGRLKFTNNSDNPYAVTQEHTEDDDVIDLSSSSTIHAPRKVERKTLALYPLRSHFFKKITVQEPTYKELVLLFRKKAADDASSASSGIFIQRFYDVPMKNLRTVFPVRKVGWNWADFLYFMMLVSWVVTLSFKAFATIAHSTYLDEAVLGILFLLLPLFVRYVNRKIAQQRSQSLCNNLLTDSLVNNSLNCNKSVLSYIKECAVEQEMKEVLLAYFIIWRWGAGISQDELDGAVEHTLKLNFQLEVDFEITDALHKLVNAGVAFERDGLYYAVPPDLALERLKDQLTVSAQQHFQSRLQ